MNTPEQGQGHKNYATTVDLAFLTNFVNFAHNLVI